MHLLSEHISGRKEYQILWVSFTYISISGNMLDLLLQEECLKMEAVC